MTEDHYGDLIKKVDAAVAELNAYRKAKTEAVRQEIKDLLASAEDGIKKATALSKGTTENFFLDADFGDFYLNNGSWNSSY